MIKIPISRSLAVACSAFLVSVVGAIGGVAVGLDAEKEDQLTDSNTDGRANPGETVKYTVRVSNPAGDATNLSLQDVLDGRTALSGTVKSKPLALPDAFSTVGNIRIQVPAATGLLANDVDAENIISVDGARQFPGRAANFGLTATAETKPTPNGGSVTIAADGSFTYDPPPGFIGDDTFAYTLEDPDTNTDIGAATVTIGGPTTWFVDAAAVPGGNGTQGLPFVSLAAFTASGGGGNGDLVFVASNASPYDGGIQLKSGQTLIGQGVSLASFLVAPTGATLPGTGPSPTIVNSTASFGGRGIELAVDNTLSGLSVGDTPNGAGIFGNGFGTLTVDSSVSILGNGAALDLASGTLAAAFSSITVLNGGANAGVRATAVTGNLDLGVCNLTTTAGKGLELSGGATVNSSSGSISTTTGIAVDIDNAPLGLTLTSVSCDGAPIGIELTNTSGSLTVTGDGASGVQGGNGSGGNLQNTTGDAIRLSNATNISLQHMTIGDPAADPSNSPDATANINGDGIEANMVTGLTLDQCTIARTGDHGINATALTGLSVTNCLVLNAGDANEEHGVRLRELAGDNFVRDSLFDAFNETGIELINTGGSVDLTIDNTSFQDNQATVGNFGEEAILLVAQGTATITALVTGDSDTSTTDSIFDDIDREAIQAIPEQNGSINLTVENSRFLEHGAGDGIIIFNPDGAGSGSVTVSDNFFTDDTLGPFAVLLKNDSSGLLDATLTGNTVNKMQFASINHDDMGGAGPANGTSRMRIENNMVDVQSSNIGIDVIASETGPAGSDPDCSLTILNNDITIVDGNFTFTGGMRIHSTNATRMNVDIRGNTANSDPSASGGAAIELQTFDSSSVGIAGLAGAADAFLDANNILSGPAFTSGAFIVGAPVLPAATPLPSP